MASFNKVQVFVDNINDGVHNMSAHQLIVFLTTNANAPTAASTILSGITVISYTNLSTRNITTVSSTQSSGTYKLILTDLVLTASGAVATFRWVGIYNDTPTSPADPIVCYFDYGSDNTMANGDTFTIDFDGTNGLYSMS